MSFVLLVRMGMLLFWSSRQGYWEGATSIFLSALYAILNQSLNNSIDELIDQTCQSAIQKSLCKLYCYR